MGDILPMFKDTALYEYCERLIALKGKDKQTFKLVLDNRTIKELIVFLNTSDQMGQDHIDSLGQSLFNKFTERTTYSLFDKKRRGGKPYELKDTGEYWRSFRATVGEGIIVISSDPFKEGYDIEEDFGNNLEGLTDENLQVLINQAYEFYIRWYTGYLLR